MTNTDDDTFDFGLEAMLEGGLPTAFDLSFTYDGERWGLHAVEKIYGTEFERVGWLREELPQVFDEFCDWCREVSAEQVEEKRQS
jgi:hypothetical protein